MECPKAGFAILEDESHRHVVPTVCKSWRCESCREKLRMLYQMRMEYGCSKVGRCLVMTVTYELGNRGVVDAASARADLRVLWSRLRRRENWRDATWCRVTELTKNGQVHFHLLVGRVTGSDSCFRSVKRAKYGKWIKGLCGGRKECLTHELAREWLAVTGDSYIVHAEYQRSRSGSVSYLAKYLVKRSTVWSVLSDLGFKRRWTCARDWPSPGRLRLAGSTGVGQEGSAWVLPSGRVRTVPQDLLASYQGMYWWAGRRKKDACAHMDTVGLDLGLPYRRAAGLKLIKAKLGVVL